MMEKFERWFKSQEERELTPHEWVQEAWQEATKQRDAQYELMAGHTKLSIREDAVIGERKRIVDDLREWAKDPDLKRMAVYFVPSFVLKIANRIERDGTE